MKKNVCFSRLTRIPLAAAFMCVIAPLALPIGGIPFTLGTFSLYLIALCFSPIDAFAILVLYIGIGAVGMPVFSGFSGGAQMLIGPTGGFLLAYPFVSFLISFVGGGYKGGFARWFFALLLGTILLYVCGGIVYLFVTDTPFCISILWLFLPLFIADFLKMAAALFIFLRLAPFLEKKG